MLCVLILFFANHLNVPIVSLWVFNFEETTQGAPERMKHSGRWRKIDDHLLWFALNQSKSMLRDHPSWAHISLCMYLIHLFICVLNRTQRIRLKPQRGENRSPTTAVFSSRDSVYSMMFPICIPALMCDVENNRKKRFEFYSICSRFFFFFEEVASFPARSLRGI